MSQETESVGGLVSRLVDDGKRFGHAQVAIYRAEVGGRMDDVKSAAIFGVSGFLLANAALVALLVGLIMALAEEVGPLWATFIVVVVTLVIAGILAKMAMSAVGRVTESKP